MFSLGRRSLRPKYTRVETQKIEILTELVLRGGHGEASEDFAALAALSPAEACMDGAGLLSMM